MQVTTDRFGDLEVPEERLLSFPDGLPGFPTSRRFALVDGRDSGVFYWLQSLDDPALAFLCAVPWAFFPEYALDISDADEQALELSSADQAMVLSLLTVHRDEQRITANLLGPVVVNQVTRQGRQVVLPGAESLLQAPLPTA